MYPGFNTQKVLHEERVRQFLADASLTPRYAPHQQSGYKRIFSTLALACIALFSAILLLVPTPVAANDDLRGLLLPPTDCSAPCFGGIRPGTTTVDEAVNLLRANSSIELIRVNVSHQYEEQSVEAFVALPPERVSLLLNAQRGVVETITLTGIDLRMDDVVQMFGEPDQLVLNYKLNNGFTTYAAFFPQYQLTAVFHMPEPADFSAAWSADQRVTLVIGSAQRYAEQTDYYLPSIYQDGGAQF